MRSGRQMIRRDHPAGSNACVVAILALALPCTATAAQAARPDAKRPARAVGSFTPSLIDAPVTALRPGTATTTTARQFRFTPASQSAPNHAVSVATHSRLATATSETARADAPTGYDIGLAVGTRGLALSGTAKRSDMGLTERNQVSLGLGYGIRDWTTTLKVGQETSLVRGAAALDPEKRYSVEFGSAYSLGRDVKVGAGLRYRVVPGDTDTALKPVNDRAAFVGLGVAF